MQSSFAMETGVSSGLAVAGHGRGLYRDGVEYEAGGAGSPGHEPRLTVRDGDKRHDRCRASLSHNTTRPTQAMLDGTGTIALPCSRCNCTTSRLALPSHSVIHSSTHPVIPRQSRHAECNGWLERGCRAAG
jgi:hypothetical protein